MERAYSVPIDDAFGRREIAISVLKHPESDSHNNSNTSRSRVAIVCHGMFCDMNTGALIPSLAGFLSEDWSVCRIDFAGNGRSSGDWSYALYGRDVADIDAVSGYLDTVLGLKTGLIVGHSKGGAAVILHGAAGIHGRECPHISVAGRVDYDPANCEKRFTQDEKDTIKRNGYILKTAFRKEWMITQGALDERMELGVKIVKALQSLECPLLHIHGTADTTVPPEEAEIVRRNAAKATVEYVEDADHLFKGKESILAWKINEWIKTINNN